jgi:flagellar basal-body rod protein FlgC
MSGISIGNALDIALSGLRANRVRMDVISANIANAYTTRTSSGGPYRRQSVTLSTEADGLGGVEITGVVPDMKTEFKSVLDPGHEHADKDGHVLMPNVELPMEMVRLVSASRAYQANAAALKRYQEMIDLTVELLR